MFSKPMVTIEPFKKSSQTQEIPKLQIKQETNVNMDSDASVPKKTIFPIFDPKKSKKARRRNQNRQNRGEPKINTTQLEPKNLQGVYNYLVNCSNMKKSTILIRF